MKTSINNNRVGLRCVFFYIVMLLLAGTGCTKYKYNTVSNPTYLRVFNSLNYTVDVTNKDQPPPFLAMIIDPVYDGSGMITGGKTIGDFLGQRGAYAPPANADAGNTSYVNSEYPGNAQVPVGSIVNGINVSAWAAIPSGEHRIVFYSRPVNSTPFFSLPIANRKNLLVDTTINMGTGNIYTMEVLQKNMNVQIPLPAELYVRQEQFANTAFADSLLYVNFYNLSAQGYAAANSGFPSVYLYQITNAGAALADTLNIFYSLYYNDARYPITASSTAGDSLVPGYNNVPIGMLIRSHNGSVAPYCSLPLFGAQDTTGGILSQQWELFVLMRPGWTPLPGPGAATSSGMVNANLDFGAIGCSNLSADGKGGSNHPPRDANSNFLASCWLPNLIKYTASGNNVLQSFATISSIEIINNQVYMMSVQRTYLPPAH